MNPRLPTSKKWTPLPSELCDQVKEVCAESFPTLAKRGKFVVEGRIYPSELLVRIGFLEKGRLLQANFEVSLDMDPMKQNALQLIHFAIDCAASMIQDYVALEEDIHEFPHQWKAFDIEKRKVYLQVSTINSNLEAEADRLLGVAAEDLVAGDDEEELTAKISMLGLDSTEDDFEDEDASTAESEGGAKSKRAKGKGAAEKDEDELSDYSDDDSDPDEDSDTDEEDDEGGGKKIH